MIFPMTSATYIRLPALALTRLTSFTLFSDIFLLAQSRTLAQFIFRYGLVLAAF